MKVLVFLLEYSILVLFPPLAIFKTDQFQLLRREMNQQGAATLSCYEELQATGCTLPTAPRGKFICSQDDGERPTIA